MTEAPFRRIVTGHNSQGKAIILEDSPPPRVQRKSGPATPSQMAVKVNVTPICTKRKPLITASSCPVKSF